MADIPIAVGVVATVPVLIQSVDPVAATAVIRVVDNNGNFLSPAATLPTGILTPVAFQVSIGDVLEQATPEARTAVVRWVNNTGQWSESPTGVPGRDTVGWRKLGTFPLPEPVVP